MEITFVQYVLASGSLDNVGSDSPATLYTWNGTEVQAVFQGTLTEVNVEAEKVDEKLAKKIDDGEIDGVMFVSASPDGANRQAMEACARTKIPMAGTGGSGVALTQNMGCNVLSASGTTGTTNRTRAVAFTTALAKYWKIKYMPVIGNTGENAVSKAEGNIWKCINFRGIMMTSLPAFIAMALCLACSKIPGCGSLSYVFDTLVNSIPIVICAIAAKQVSGLDEVGVVAGIVVGICSGYDCCNGMCICNYDGGKCTGEKKEWKNSSEKSLKKLKKLVDNQGDLRYNRFCCEGHKRNGTQ